jgi:hypothetical protein
MFKYFPCHNVYRESSVDLECLNEKEYLIFGGSFTYFDRLRDVVSRNSDGGSILGTINMSLSKTQIFYESY